MEVRGIGYTNYDGITPVTVIGNKAYIGSLDWKRVAKAVLSGGASETNLGKKAEEKAIDVAKDVVKAGAKFISITSLWPSRSAFVNLVKLNFRGYATRMSNMDDLSKIKSTWEKLGGAWGDVWAAINHGKDKPYLFGIKKGEGARGETDSEFLSVVKNKFELENGPFEDIIFDTAGAPLPGQTPTGSTSVQIKDGPTNINDVIIPGGGFSAKIGYGEAAVAGYIAAGAAVLTAIGGLISTNRSNKIADKEAQGLPVTKDEYEKEAKAKAFEAYNEAYQKSIAGGASEAIALAEATKASALEYARLKAIYEEKLRQQKNTDNGTDTNNDSLGVNLGAFFKQNALLIGAGLLLAIGGSKLLK
jgi:hypothetical protein